MILKTLEKICTALDANGIPYMLSGSLAMNLYVTPRMTRDIDIVVNLELSNLDRFLSIFKEGYYFSEDTVKEEIERRGMFNILDYSDGMKLDFIVRKDTEFHKQEFSRRYKTQVYGYDMWVVSLEDLIISKLKWIQQLQSDTQKNDIRNLLDSSEIDRKYIKGWLKKLNLKTFDLLNDA